MKRLRSDTALMRCEPMKQNNPLRFFLLSVRELLSAGIAGTAGIIILSIGIIKLYSPTGETGLDFEIGAMIIYPIFIYCFVLPFILTYKQFGYLHNKAQSDFYGSIPKSSFGIFTAKFSAVLTVQLLSAAVVYFTVNHLLWKHNIILFGAGLRVPSALLLMSACLCAVAVIAISLCGSMSSSAVVYFVLTFAVPSLFTSIGNLYISYNHWPYTVLPPKFSPPFFYKIVSGILGLDALSGLQFFSGKVIYWRAVFPNSALIWGAVSIPIFSILAFLTYRNVKTQPEAGVRRPVTGHIAAAALAAPICIRTAVAYIDKRNYYSSIRYREIFVLFMLALLIFLIAEFICTYSFKRLIRSLPVFAGVLIAAAVTSISVKINTEFYPTVPEPPEYIEINNICSMDDYFDLNYISAHEDIAGKVKVNDSEPITQLQRDPSMGKNKTHYIQYNMCSQGKSEPCYDFANEELIEKLIKSANRNNAQLFSQENVCEIVYDAQIESKNWLDESTARSVTKIGFIENSGAVLNSFYREFSQLTEQQALAALYEIGNTEDTSQILELRLKNGKVLKCRINSADFPETKSLLDNLVREELNKYGNPAFEYKIL